MALFCWKKDHVGGADNPIRNCSPPPNALGRCVTMAFPDSRYCDRLRYEVRYDPTQEETDEYPDREWIRQIGDALFESVFGAFDAAISTATGGIVDEWLTFEGSAEELLARTIANGQDAALKLAGEIGGKLSGLTAEVLNDSAAAMGEFLGVARAQERIADEVVGAVDYLLKQGEWEAETHLREAVEAQEAAMAAVEAQLQYDAWVAAQTAGVFSQDVVDLSNLETVNVATKANELLGFTFDTFAVNREIMYNLASLHGIEVANSFASIADAELDNISEIYLEGVVRPQAQAEAFYVALKDANEATDAEYEESVLRQYIINAEIAAATLNTEVNMLDVLRARLEAL